MSPLVRVVRTCTAIPSQWSAWTVDGQYLYLRYRSGIGTVDAYDTEDSEQWTRIPDGAIARFDTGDRLDGDVDLAEFCQHTGLQLAAGCVVLGEDDPPVQCWHIEPGTPCDWDICRQPERLAAGDRGVDPADGRTGAH